MSLTAIERVRRDSSDRSTITRDVVTADGVNKAYKLKHYPILSTPAIEVRQNGSLLVLTTDYTIDLSYGIVTLVVLPTVNDELEFTYYWSIFTDVEIQDYLDENGNDTTIATAKLLLAWAADASKLAKRQTLSGGGGTGQVVVDTSVAARELRETAKALITLAKDLGESIPAEFLTEIPWTEQVYHRQVEQHLIRES